jgi:hypothetical protein
VHWLDLGGRAASAVLVELRRAGVDDWWPGWDVAMGGVRLEGELLGQPAPAAHTSLDCAALELTPLPRGVRAERRGSEVRYRTRFLEVGFDLARAAFTYLSWDSEGTGRTQRNLLKVGPADGAPPELADYLAQGLRLHPVAGPASAAYTAHAVTGTVEVSGSAVVYDLHLDGTGQHYRLAWEVAEDRLALRAERIGERPLRAWTSGVWHLAFDSRVIPGATLGQITRQGETGLMALPVLLHGAGVGRAHGDQGLRGGGCAGAGDWAAADRGSGDAGE